MPAIGERSRSTLPSALGGAPQPEFAYASEIGKNCLILVLPKYISTDSDILI